MSTSESAALVTLEQCRVAFSHLDTPDVVLISTIFGGGAIALLGALIQRMHSRYYGDKSINFLVPTGGGISTLAALLLASHHIF